MIPRFSPSLRPSVVALCTRWLVLFVIMFGTMISSIGGTNSHGLAVVAAALHGAQSSAGEAHGPVHEGHGGELVLLDRSAASDHPQHGTDHSHDKAHALSVAWGSASPQLPGWSALGRPWIEMVEASRLERPPMG
jgi:hypothetical protein